MFVLSIENEDDITSFSKCYIPNVQIEDFNVFIDGKSFFGMPIKNKEETYEQIIEVERNNDYTTDNLLDHDYFSNHYKLIAIYLRKQNELENPDLKQQINLIGKILRDGRATMFFTIEKETQKIANLLGDADNESSKFATRMYYVINDQNNIGYGEGTKDSATIKFESKVIKSSFCENSDVYIFVTGDITAEGGNENNCINA